MEGRDTHPGNPRDLRGELKPLQASMDAFKKVKFQAFFVSYFQSMLLC